MCATRSGLPSAECPVLQRCAGSVRLGQPAQREPVARDAGHFVGQAGELGETGRRGRGTAAARAARPAPGARRAAGAGVQARRGASASNVGGGGQAARDAGAIASRVDLDRATTDSAPEAGRVIEIVGRACEDHARRERWRSSSERPVAFRRRHRGAGRGGRRLAGALEQHVRRDVQRVREALQLVGGEASPPGLDAADGGLVDAHPLGQGALAPALLLTQAGRSACLCSRDARRASFPSPPPSTLLHHCTPQYARLPASASRLQGLA